MSLWKVILLSLQVYYQADFRTARLIHRKGLPKSMPWTDPIVPALAKQRGVLERGKIPSRNAGGSSPGEQNRGGGGRKSRKGSLEGLCRGIGEAPMLYHSPMLWHIGKGNTFIGCADKGGGGEHIYLQMREPSFSPLPSVLLWPVLGQQGFCAYEGGKFHGPLDLSRYGRSVYREPISLMSAMNDNDLILSITQVVWKWIQILYVQMFY